MKHGELSQLALDVFGAAGSRRRFPYHIPSRVVWCHSPMTRMGNCPFCGVRRGLLDHHSFCGLRAIDHKLMWEVARQNVFDASRYSRQPHCVYEATLVKGLRKRPRAQDEGLRYPTVYNNWLEKHK